jgi:23S rRNA (uridine2552-2'-O)-methyltransferase
MLKLQKKFDQSSRNWILRQKNDEYYMQSKKDGYRSRSSYKLIEINDKYKVIENKKFILDLGAAPGGWTQVVRKIKHKQKNHRIIAIDLLPMEPIEDVIMIQGDFTEEKIQKEIVENFDNNKPDLILSDIAPNMSGVAIQDQLKASYISEMVAEFVKLHLSEGGDFVIKMFQSPDTKKIELDLKKIFNKVSYFKPKASRKESSEIYLIAQKLIYANKI